MAAADSASSNASTALTTQFSKGRSGNRLKWLPQRVEDGTSIVRTAYDASDTPRPTRAAKPAIISNNAPAEDVGKLPAEPKLDGAIPGPKVDESLPEEEPARTAPPAKPLGSPNVSPLDSAPATPLKPNKPDFRNEQEFAPRQHEFKEGCPSPKDLKNIADLTTNIAPSEGEVPPDCPLGNGAKFAGRSFAPTTFTWTASSLCHKPLYFEDVQLERYGHMGGPLVQPVASAVNFFLTFPILPYKMGLETPNECMYSLGYYRPGDCAPYLFDPLPLSVRGAIFEAGAWAGGVAAFP